MILHWTPASRKPSKAVGLSLEARTVKLLLDTHIVLWTLVNDPRLKPPARRLLDEASVRYVSAASTWEIAIKMNKGALTSISGFKLAWLQDAGFDLLIIDHEDTLRAGALAFDHQDPFDRILIAQAERHGLTLLSLDRKIREYAGIPVLP